MSGDEKSGLKSIDVVPAALCISVPVDAVAKDGTTLLETQTRTRRLFSQAQLFAFSLVYLGTWYSTAM